jgi:uncharacterized cupin superfamily protein
MLCHRDLVERARRDVGDMRSWWRDLGAAAGATAVGVQRVEVDPGARIGPVHTHAAEEEIVFVLAGSGLAWIDGAAHEIGAGDTIVYLAGEAGGPYHTLVAGDDGLDVLCFGEDAAPPLVHLPRAGVLRRGAFWTLAGEEPGPPERESAAGRLGLPEPSPRPKCIVALDDAPVDVDEKGEFAWTARYVAHAAGSVRTGLRHTVIPAGRASGFAHMFRAGERDMTMLLYGQRNGNEIVFYPRSRKAWVGQVMVRFETVDDYWDGEV